MKAAHRCTRFIPSCSEDFALADEKLFSLLRDRDMAYTTVDTHKAFTEPRNDIFKNIFARVLKSSILVQETGQACL